MMGNSRKPPWHFSAAYIEIFRTLTSISGFAEIIQNGIVKPEDIPRFAGNIYMESQRLISLVDDILNLSRLDEADVQLEREDFDLSAVQVVTIMVYLLYLYWLSHCVHAPLAVYMTTEYLFVIMLGIQSVIYLKRKHY